jgi:putative ABC transport system permease protein
MLYLRLLKESLFFAIDSLVVNKLRTILSLLGITIGIFAMVSVFTMVDSLENNIRSSISSLGDNVIYVAKMPWDFDPNQPWWDYIKRPQPDLNEFKMLKKQIANAEAIAMVLGGGATVKFENNSMNNVEGTGVTSEYNQIWDLKIEKGRYITDLESNGGRPVGVIGADVASGLFGSTNPIGKKLKIKGRKLEVIGILAKEGESIMGQTNDRKIFMPLQFARNFYNLKSRNSNAVIMVRAKDGVGNEELKDELTGVMRSLRKLKPKVKNDFALNEMSMLSQGFDAIFGVINISGFVIGIFSILVGGFSIANIMFVSVKERTSLIGIQKSLGAKNFFILFQFLFESVFLCLIGGAIGLFFIFLGTLVMTYIIDFPTTLGLSNILLGVGLSAGIGIIAGIIPSYQASRLDPVEAIRTN